MLGTVNQATQPAAFNPALLAAYTDPSHRFPRLFCPIESDILIQIIVFDRPQPTRMQYFSLTPMSLTLDDKSDKVAKGISPLDGIDAAEERERKRKMELVEKLRLHSVIRYPRTQKELMLPLIIDQVNCSSEIASLLQRNVGLVGTRIRRGLSVSERVVESATNLWDYVLAFVVHVALVWLFPVMINLLIIGLVTHRVAAEVLLRILEWRPTPDSPALKDISATAQQMDIRLQQFCYWPIQYLTLRKRKANWESITTSHPEYIRFFNSLWLVANDVIIGIALGSYIIDNANLVAVQVDTVLQQWSIEGLRRMIAWLMDWPAGLKLNNELAAFLGDLFLWVIDYWAGKCTAC